MLIELLKKIYSKVKNKKLKLNKSIKVLFKKLKKYFKKIFLLI